MSDGGSPITVVVQNELDDGDPEWEVDLDRWRDLAQAVLHTERVDSGELNLLFVGETKMAELAIEHMGGDGPTDVLAFPIDGASLTDMLTAVHDPVPTLLGDVIICPAMARRYAAANGVAFDDEVALLVVHGVLHVLGHDHTEPAETVTMKAREQMLLAAHHRS